MENLNIYNQVRKVPSEALRQITAGRLKGKSDINPMWRIQKLTAMFGVCGFGWKYKITKQWIENGANDEKAAFVNIDLFIKIDGEWSDAIPGNGGSSFVAKELKGLYTSDECFKMALTDAISVSCKALGFAADVYWDKDSTKYNKPANTTSQSNTWAMSEGQRKRLFALQKEANVNDENLKIYLKKNFNIDSRNNLNKLQYDKLCKDLEKQASKIKQKEKEAV